MNIEELDKISKRLHGYDYFDCIDCEMLESSEERIQDLELQVIKGKMALLVEKGLLEYYKSKDK